MVALHISEATEPGANAPKIAMEREFIELVQMLVICVQAQQHTSEEQARRLEIVEGYMRGALDPQAVIRQGAAAGEVGHG